MKLKRYLPADRKLVTKKMTAMGMLSALSIIFALSLSFPIFPATPFLRYDFADVPILICTFLFGPSAGVIVTLIVSAVQSAILGDFPYGFFMHTIATCTLVLIAGNIYNFKKKRTFKLAVVGTVIGIIGWVVVMIIANLTLTPFYMGASREAVIKLLLPAIIPFNIIKAAGNSIITLILYRQTYKLFNNMLELNGSFAPNKKDVISENKILEQKGELLNSEKTDDKDVANNLK